MERHPIRNGHFILATAVFALLAVLPAYGQASSSPTFGYENGLMAGDQFPEGTSNCSGSRFHHAHDYPGRFSCSKQVNSHYSTTVGSSPCTQRAKDECGCEDCCRKQTKEAKDCFCGGRSECKSLADYAQTVCEGNCLSTYLDECEDDEFTEPSPGQG